MTTCAGLANKLTLSAPYAGRVMRPLASLWKLRNISSYKILYLWFDHNYSRRGHAWQKSGRAAKVCYSGRPVLQILLLGATRLPGTFTHSTWGRSCFANLARSHCPFDSPLLKPLPPTCMETYSVNSFSAPFYQGLSNGSLDLSPGVYLPFPPKKKSFLLAQLSFKVLTLLTFWVV